MPGGTSAADVGGPGAYAEGLVSMLLPIRRAIWNTQLSWVTDQALR